MPYCLDSDKERSSVFILPSFAQASPWIHDNWMANAILKYYMNWPCHVWVKVTYSKACMEIQACKLQDFEELPPKQMFAHCTQGPLWGHQVLQDLPPCGFSCRSPAFLSFAIIQSLLPHETYALTQTYISWMHTWHISKTWGSPSI